MLCIGGSDPSSGAGIQSDVMAASALGCHAFTAITAVTGQNTSGFSGAESVSGVMLESQIDSILSDFEVNSVKIGMVLNVRNIRVIYRKISKLGIPVIVDPVIKSTTGGILLEKNALGGFKKFIIPMASIITPNVRELGILSGRMVRGKNGIAQAASTLMELGAKSVVVTGFESGGMVYDHVFSDNVQKVMSGKKIAMVNHGSGCDYSAALACAIAKGNGVMESAIIAKKFARNSIKNAVSLGGGIAITKYMQSGDVIKLKKAISDFTAQKKIWNHIPECQTNFVFARKNPKSAKDILGLDGRIIRARKKVIVAGGIVFGGSRHVAAAVLQMNKKFPGVRSGVNIKYNADTIQRIRKKGLRVAHYDRKDEPESVKSREGSSVSWGIKSVIKNMAHPPDAIYHEGDFGKEPMIIVFGKEPDDVVRKISEWI